MIAEGKEEEDALERRGFRNEVDLHLSAIEQTNARKREKEERERDNQKNTNKTIYQNIKN